MLCAPAPLGSVEGIPGSVRIKADCGHRVSVAPSGVPMLLNPTINPRTKCLNCLPPEELRRIVDEQKVREIPGSREELEGEIGAERADAVFKAARAKRLGED